MKGRKIGLICKVDLSIFLQKLKFFLNFFLQSFLPVCSLLLATMKKKIGRGENKRNFLKPHIKLVQQTPQRLLNSCKMKGNFSTINNRIVR